MISILLTDIYLKNLIQPLINVNDPDVLNILISLCIKDFQNKVNRFEYLPNDELSDHIFNVYNIKYNNEIIGKYYNNGYYYFNLNVLYKKYYDKYSLFYGNLDHCLETALKKTRRYVVKKICNDEKFSCW
jgi:hypothetical protein